MKRRSSCGFTLVELLVVIAIIGILIGMLLPAVQQVREAARRVECANKVRQISLAVMNFESGHMRFPQGWESDVIDFVDTPGWGWAANLLPFVEQNNLFAEIDFGVSIRAPINENILQQAVETYLCPSDPAPRIVDLSDETLDGGSTTTNGPSSQDDGGLSIARSNYSGVFGNLEVNNDPFEGSGTFFGNSRIGFRDIRDGSSNTLMIGERRNDRGAITWLGVLDRVAENYARCVGATDHAPNDDDGGFENFRSYHSGGVNMGVADGSIQFIGDDITESVFQALGSRSGGEVARF